LRIISIILEETEMKGAIIYFFIGVGIICLITLIVFIVGGEEFYNSLPWR